MGPQVFLPCFCYFAQTKGWGKECKRGNFAYLHYPYTLKTCLWTLILIYKSNFSFCGLSSSQKASCVRSPYSSCILCASCSGHLPIF